MGNFNKPQSGLPKQPVPEPFEVQFDQQTGPSVVFENGDLRISAGNSTSETRSVTVLVAPDLWAEYTFFGNAADSSGNGHDAAVVGATLTSDRFGHSESAYAFSGAEGKYIVDSSISDFPGGNCAKTVSRWVDQDQRYLQLYSAFRVASKNSYAFTPGGALTEGTQYAFAVTFTKTDGTESALSDPLIVEFKAQ